jgi:hypothetical protein
MSKTNFKVANLNKDSKIMSTIRKKLQNIIFVAAVENTNRERKICLNIQENHDFKRIDSYLPH